MDGSRFDELTKRLGATRSRRSALRLLASAVAAGGLLGRDAAAAGRRSPGDVCRKDADCASGRCGPKDATGRPRCLCVAPNDCPSPRDACQAAVCDGGLCATVATVDLQTDPTNCGRCGTVCPSAICENGACVALTTTTAAPTTTTTTTAAPTTAFATSTTAFATTAQPTTTALATSTTARATTTAFVTTTAHATTTAFATTTPGV